jgi:hypothetical protein
MKYTRNFALMLDGGDEEDITPLPEEGGGTKPPEGGGTKPPTMPQKLIL